MKEIKRPYNAKALIKWSAFRVTAGKEDKVYDLELTPLTELVKQPGYEKFKDRFNWLYKNYSTQNFDLVWKELQDHNEDLKEDLIRQDTLRKSEMTVSYQMRDIKDHFGEIPEWIQELSPEKHALLLDRARLLYEIEPDYEVCKLYLKDIYTVPEMEVMDYKEISSPVYRFKQYEDKDGNIISCSALDDEAFYESMPIYHELKPSELNGPLSYNTIVGSYTHESQAARLIAEQAVIRDVYEFYRYHPEFKSQYSMEDMLTLNKWELELKYNHSDEE